MRLSAVWTRAGRARGGMAALVAAALALTACGSGGGAGGEAANGGTIAIGTTFAPTTLDPQSGTSGADFQYLYFLFDRLIQYDQRSGELRPMLATSWEFTGAKKLDLRLTLRQGVKFQDGTPLDAQAVVFTLKRHIANGDIVNDLQYVRNVEARGQDTVLIHLSQQNALLPYGLANRAGMIVSPTAVRKDQKGFGTHPVGAGPYRFVSQAAGSRYAFTRYDGYWNNAALRRVKNVSFKIFGNDTSLVTAVRTGDVQVGGALFPQDVSLLRREKDLDVAVGPGLTVNMVYFNGRLKPFNDPRVRLAFNLALDRDAVMRAASNGLGKVWTEPIPPGNRGYVPELEPLFRRDVARAKQLMAQAGYPNGVDVSCYTYPGLGFDITGPIVIAQMRQIGIRMKIVSGTPAQVVPFYTKNLAPCYLSGWLNGANPIVTYRGILWSKSFYNAGKADFGVDRYVDRFFTTYTEVGKDEIYRAINASQRTNPGYAPIYSNPTVNVYRKSVDGWIVSPYGLNNWQGLTFAGSS
jgi:peptide/nickel transport system substrate-binding protein